MSVRLITLSCIGALLIAALAAAAEPRLAGRWVVNQELSKEVQPEGPEQRSLLDSLPRTSVSVGGVPLPTGGSQTLPSAPGNPRDPKVLRCSELRIEPQGEDLHLSYAQAGSETLKRGDDQGLVSRWSADKLTTRYETTSRKVSQVYEVRDDGRLLVTVKLNPNQGPTIVHKRVFDPAR